MGVATVLMLVVGLLFPAIPGPAGTKAERAGPREPVFKAHRHRAHRRCRHRHRCKRRRHRLPAIRERIAVGATRTSAPNQAAGSPLPTESPSPPSTGTEPSSPPPAPPPPEPPPPDTTPPQTTISVGPATKTAETSATFRFTASEAGASFQCALDGAAWSACASPASYTGVAVGSHEFAVRASDGAGNTDPTPATYFWTVDPPQPPAPPPPSCSTVVSSTAAVQSAVSGAAPGDIVCLADGSYGSLSLSASKSSQVVVQAQNAGQATIDGASLSGSHLTLARFDVTDEVVVQPGSSGMTVEHNRITGGYFGVDAGPTTSTTVNDVSIVGNQFVGPYGEDGVRLNRYHDADGDGIGALVEGNEFTGIRENGNHSDCLQTVWVGDHLVFRGNYLHDNRCQGFFVKDQASPIVGIRVEDNLFLRDTEPCAPSNPECGQPLYFQVFGPYTDFVMRRNTIWAADSSGGTAAFREGSGADLTAEANVVYRFWTDTNLSAMTYADNTRCKRDSSGGSWPAQVSGETVTCSPPFNDPTSDDYRLLGSERGVDWRPADRHFGP